MTHQPAITKPSRGQRIMGSMQFGLSTVGFATLLKGVSYFPPLREVSRSPAHWLEYYFPMTEIGVVWCLVGLLCFVAMFYQRIRTLAWSLVMMLYAAWMVSFTLNWVLYQGRSWVSAVSYFTIVALLFWGLARRNREANTL